MAEDNGRQSTFVKYVLSISATVFVGFIYWSIGNNSKIDTALNDLKISVAEVRKDISQIQKENNQMSNLLFSTSREQIERITKFGEIDTKTIILEREIQALTSDMKSNANKIAELQRRVDEKLKQNESR